jgi:hypothetical protein
MGLGCGLEPAVTAPPSGTPAIPSTPKSSSDITGGGLTAESCIVVTQTRLRDLSSSLTHLAFPSCPSRLNSNRRYDIQNFVRPAKFVENLLDQWFPTSGTRTLGGTRRTGCGYAKIILVMAENTKKKKRELK